MDPSPKDDGEPEPSESHTAAPGRPHAPGAVRAAVALLWMLAVLALYPTAIGIIFTIFQLSLDETISVSEILTALPAPILAALAALLAVKLWTGRDWARQAVLIVVFMSLALTFTFPGNLLQGPAPLLWVTAIAMVVLLTRRTARDWCDPEAAVHSPRIRPAPQPPFRVVATLLLLWTATGYALFLATATLLSMTQDADDFVNPTRTGWIMAGLIALALGHTALNIGLAHHRNWARLGTAVLMALYAVVLVGLAVSAATREGSQPWAVQLLVALVPLAFIWALLNNESREWCLVEEKHPSEPGPKDEPGDDERPANGRA